MKKEESIPSNSIIVVGLLFLYALFSFNEEINRVMLYTAVPAAFLISLFSSLRIKMNYAVKICLVLFAWIAFTALFSYDINQSWLHLKKCLGVLLLILTVQNTASNQRTIVWLYGVWFLYYIVLVVFAYNLYLTGGFVFGAERLASEDFNPNMLGYYTFYFTFIIFIFPVFLHSHFLKNLFHIVFILLIPWSFILAIATGTRQILIIQAPLIAFLLYIRYLQPRKGGSKLLSVLLLASVFIVALTLSWNTINNMYSNSVLSKRNERSFDEDARLILIKDATSVGLSHPIVGVGPGNYQLVSVLHLYSHNTYTELLANSGFPALVLFCFLVGRFIIVQFKRFHRYRDSTFLSFACFGFFYLLDSAFIVVYIVPWLLPFFVLVACHSDIYYKYCYASYKSIDYHRRGES